MFHKIKTTTEGKDIVHEIILKRGLKPLGQGTLGRKSAKVKVMFSGARGDKAF